MVTGSLQIKGLVYYIVLNVYPNNKRNQKWIPKTVVANGKKVNQLKAEKLLSDLRMIYDKDSYIDNKKTAEQLLEQKRNYNNSNSFSRQNLFSKQETKKLSLTNKTLSNEEELIITKCLSNWYNTSKETMIDSLMNIIKENPNTHLDESNKEISAQVLVAKFQYILTNYNETEFYEMKNETLNNIYEDIDKTNNLKEIEKVDATVQN